MVRNQAIVAGTLAARKLAQYNSGTRVPATICAIADSIRWSMPVDVYIDASHGGWNRDFEVSWHARYFRHAETLLSSRSYFHS